METKFLIKVAILAAVVVPAGAAQASLTVSFFNGITNSNQSTSTAAGGPISLSGADSTVDGRALAGSALADYGVAKATATATGSAFGQVQSEARAMWGDSITITTPGSSSGFFTARMAFENQLGFGAGGFSFNTFDFQFIATQNVAGDRYFYAYNLNTSFTSLLTSTLFINNNGASSTTVSNSLPDGPVVVDFLIPFTSGQAFTISSSLTCGARGNLTTAVCDAGNSAYWGGIRSVTNSNGAQLMDWSVSSGSGTNWQQSFIPATGAVPEPASWAMLIAGFGLVGATQRRRKVVVAA